MKFKLLALAGLAAASLSSHAALTTYAPWAAYWPQGSAGQGIDNVLFNVVTSGGVTAAMGAHGYKNGELLPNNGVDTYYAMTGTYPNEPQRANWSFDFAWDLGGCTTCSVELLVDTDPGAGVNPVSLFNTSTPGAIQALFGANATAVPDDAFFSWNMEMAFITPGLGGYNFNPNGYSSTDFTLRITGTNGELASSTVTVEVPEPATLALVGLALAGMGAARRRRA